MPGYSIRIENDRYVICDGDTAIRTPGGNTLCTRYRQLAERLLQDLERFGMEDRSVGSIVPWHLTMLDSFAGMSHEQAEQALTRSFTDETDWTCRNRYGAVWTGYFGRWEKRRGRIADWLKGTTLMQMTAVCCIGNAYEGINLAYTLAFIMERYEGDERRKQFETVAELMETYADLGTADSVMAGFRSFELYYGIHLSENGRLLDAVADLEELEEGEIYIDALSGSVTVAQLAGRNFYHYTYYKKDEEQPEAYAFGDFALDESEDEEEVYVEPYDEEEGYSLSEMICPDCWVKRFVDEDDPDICYLLCLRIDENGRIADSDCVRETTDRSQWSMIPGLELPAGRSYDDCDQVPDDVLEEARRVLAGRSLPIDYSFIGKRLPQSMIDEGGNGGSKTEYTFSLQSAYRLAYMHMCIETDDDGVIRDIDYSTYQSTGGGCWSMFSRPVCISDRRDEALDMLLYIYDRYTDEELAGQ